MRRRTATLATVVAIGAVLAAGLAGYGLFAPDAGNAIRGVVPDPAVSTDCTVGATLVPTCGVLWGAATGAHTNQSLTASLHEFEQDTGRTQAVFHTYHRGTSTLFPTAEEIAMANENGHPRIPFLDWKPAVASWAAIADGDPQVDDFLDRLAAHITKRYDRPFFLTIHHEPENDVRPEPGSGYTAADYARMYRHVVERLRHDGVHNVVFVMTYMGYAKWPAQQWFDQLYPGDDVVDWIALDVYAYSTPGYGYGDFAEMANRGGPTPSGTPTPPSPTASSPSAPPPPSSPSPSRSPSPPPPSSLSPSVSPSPSPSASSGPPSSSPSPSSSGPSASGSPSPSGTWPPRPAVERRPETPVREDGWPGFYDWAAKRFPDKPMMLGEWGVWTGTDTGHKAWFYDNVGTEIARFPRIKALVYFDTPDAGGGHDSRVDHPADALPAYRKLGALPIFQVTVPTPSPPALPSSPPAPPSTSPPPTGTPSTSPSGSAAPSTSSVPTASARRR